MPSGTLVDTASPQRRPSKPPAVGSLVALVEASNENVECDDASDCAADGGDSQLGSLVDSQVGHSSLVGSQVGSQVGSIVNSVVSGLTDNKTKLSVGQFSAFTAPPQYRNSGVFVHGTKFRNFRSIMDQGLKAAKSDIFMIDEVRMDGRVPGLKDPPEILLFIDEQKARSENMEFEYDFQQGTWKTKGINGVIRPWFFQKVVDQRRGIGRGNVLFQSKQDPMMQANVLKRSQQPKYLIHATYWENVFGIMKEGILPAKNPTSTLRQPFKDLLQGAESHVYTVRPNCGFSSENTLDGIPYNFERRVSEPEVVYEESEASQEVRRKVEKERVGLERQPDAFFVIDTKKAAEMGVKLEMVQSSDREETVFVQGPVPPEIISEVVPNDPIDLPEALKAKIVDPHSFHDIPIIDLRSDEATLIDQFRYACEVVGFMQVVGHGVSEELQERHMQLQRRFFAMSAEQKSRLGLDDKSPVRGYFGKGGEDLDQVVLEKVDSAGKTKIPQHGRKDHKEALDNNGVPWSSPKGGYVAQIFALPSRLPPEEELPGFQETLEEYSREMFRIARTVLSILALVLGRPRDFFEPHLTAPVATHRLLHYWPITDFSKEIGVGEHTDYGLLTLLKQDNVGGLQVLNAKDGKWVHCCPVEGAFVVNLGDMMGRWTGHRFKSTVHRVVNLTDRERFSVPYFLEPNMDTIIRPGELRKAAPATEHHRRCRLRAAWRQEREGGPRGVDAGGEEEAVTAEEILERFYRASGQLKQHAPSPSTSAIAS
mmetsp:Transcript_41048/g.87426  ORF Transcript_41048/g.87426 Transcript_41048/m.87426 type:complete len:766 (-) Transcript_41048:76-2373(-)